MSSEAPTKETATKKAATIRPDKNDVLLGRAANVFHHPGNRRYRHLVAMNLRRYKDAKTRLDKMVLIRQVTEQVIDNGRVRFLRRDEKNAEWKEVPFRTAQDKVSHALRDGINKPIFEPLLPQGVEPPEEEISEFSDHRPDSATEEVHGADPQTVSLSARVETALDDARLLELQQQEEMLKNIAQQQTFFPPSLFNRNVATASTRAALSGIVPQPRSSSAPHLQPRIPPQVHGMPDIARRASIPGTERLLPQFLQSPHPQPLGLPGSRPLDAMGPAGSPYQNVRVPTQHQPQKQMGPSPYELMLLKERQLMAESALNRAIHQARSAAITKTFLDDVVSHYRTQTDQSKPSAQDEHKRTRR